MIEILGYSFSSLGFVLTGLAAALVVSHAAWWIGRAFGKLWYFPSHFVCIAVHRNLPRLLEREWKALSKGESPTVFGFLSTALLMGIVCLNVTLLAQIFELFVPLGERLRFPFVGSYATFPLIVGLLFALVQVALSTIRKMQQQENETTYSITGIIWVTIVVETGLNFYRAWLLTSGQQAISPTLWDQVIMFGGPILAGFIGFIVPLAEIRLAPYAILDFIQPVVKDLVILIRFLLSSSILGIVWLYFAFHDKKPVILPGTVARLRAGIKALGRDASHLGAMISRVRDKTPKDRPLELHHLEQQIADLETSVNAFKLKGTTSESDGTQQKVQSFSEQIGKASDRRQLQNTIRDIRKWIRSFYGDAELAKCGIADILSKAESLPKKYEDLQNRHEAYTTELARVRRSQALTYETGPCSQWAKFYSAIDSTISGKPVPDGVLAQVELDELRELASPPERWGRHEKNWNRYVLNATRDVLQSASLELVRIQKYVKKCSDDLDLFDQQVIAKPPSLEETELVRIKKDLVAIDNRVTELEKDICDQIRDWKRDMRERALQFRSLILFLKLFLRWRRRI